MDLNGSTVWPPSGVYRRTEMNDQPTLNHADPVGRIVPKTPDRGDGGRIPGLATKIAEPPVTKTSQLLKLYFNPRINSRRPRISSDDLRTGGLPSEIGEIADAGLGAKGDNQRSQQPKPVVTEQNCNFATCTINLSRFDHFDHPCQRDSAILYPLPGCTVEGDCC